MANEETSFSECWLEFNGRSTQCEEITNFFKVITKHPEFDPNRVRSMLSIGAGDGRLDCKLLTEAFPNVQKYIAIEPDEELLKTVERRVNTLEKKDQVQVEYVNAFVQDYNGPSQPVDLIWLSHVIYHFSDTCKQQLQKIASWLAPGGCIAIVLDKETTLHNSLKSVMSLTDETYDLGVLSRCKRALRELGIEISEYSLGYTIDVSEPGLAKVLRILVDTFPAENEMEDVRQVMKGLCLPSSDRMPSVMSVFLCKLNN